MTERRNGIHLLPLPVEKKRPLLKWAAISAALAALLGAGAKYLAAVAEARVDETVKARVETITVAKVGEKLSAHDHELEGLGRRLDRLDGRMDRVMSSQADIAASLGVLLGRTANIYPAGPTMIPLRDNVGVPVPLPTRDRGR